MDTRTKSQDSGNFVVDKNQLPSELQNQIFSDDEEILNVDSSINNEKFMDAIIYNLIMKLNSQRYLENLYAQAKEADNDQVLPKALRGYVHHPFIVPFFCVPIIVMKFRKTFTWNKACMVACLVTTMNEHYKYRSCMKADEQVAQEYNEYSENYKDLFRALCRSISYKDVLQNTFSLNLNQNNFGSKSQYNQDLVEDFTMSQY